MAQARAQTRGGLAAVHFWMIGFVFLWLVATVLLVWLYTDQEGLNNRIAELERESTRLAKSTDKQLPAYQQASDTGSSALGLIEQARKATAALATGVESDDPATVRTKVTTLFERIASDGLVENAAAFSSETLALLPAMTTLYDEFATAHRLRSEAEKQALAAENRLHETLETSSAQLTSFNESTDGFKSQLSTLENRHAEFRSARENEIQGLKQQMDEQRQDYSRNIQSVRNQVEESQARIEELQKRHEELQAKLGELRITPGELLTARQADGAVVWATAGDDVVYIDLGQKDHLTVGLQFAVYPPTGIPADGRAKARIEVARIHDTTAACNIVGDRPGDPIVEGDLVANPVYDRDRPLRFVVVGQFDLDRDGQDDEAGGDAVRGIISNWGGDVLDALSSRVDFVIAGYAPVVPTVVGSSDARAAGLREREQRLAQDLAQYESVLTSASKLSVPILTQDVFLRFLGY